MKNQDQDPSTESLDPYPEPSTKYHGTKYHGGAGGNGGANGGVTLTECPEWPDGLTQYQEMFLVAYSLGGSVAAAARACDMSRMNPYRWRQSCPEFCEAFEIAKEYGVQHLEDWALSRAMDDRNPSDRLTEFLLKAARPEVYRERVDHRVSGQIEHRKRVILEHAEAAVVLDIDHDDGEET